MHELRKRVADNEERNIKDAKEKSMTSLSMFLQSSANTEMVYSILEGITKFALLNYMRDKMTVQ